MTSHEVVSILQLGFSGLAFLLANFAFALLWSQRNLQPPQPSMLHSIKSFMTFALVMAGLALLPPILEFGSKHFASETTQKAEACLAANHLLTSATTVRRTSDDLKQYFLSLAAGTTSSGPGADEGRRVSRLAAARVEQLLKSSTESQENDASAMARLLACK
jgi:hypothetical protein